MPTSKELRFALCACGKPVCENCSLCLPCLHQAQQKQQQQQQQLARYTLPLRTANSLTPPPSLPASPRRSYAMPASTTIMPPRTSRPSDASEVFTRAFADKPSESPLFPASMYRTPARSGSRNGSISSSRRPSDSPSRPSSRTLGPSSESVSSRTSRSSTPDARSPDYAPMAAGFARLSLKDGSKDPLRRSSSARPSFDLEARMFSGPA